MQADGSTCPIVHISCATLDNERIWTPIELEAGCVVSSIHRQRDASSAYSSMSTPTTRASSILARSVNLNHASNAGWNSSRHTSKVLTWVG